MKSTLEFLAATTSKRGLDFVLIGGNAVILSGFARSTADIDLMICTSNRSRWLDAMRDMEYRLFNGNSVFSQFEPVSKNGPAIDLMYVDEKTWSVIHSSAVEKKLGSFSILVPKPEHIVALKLHAAKSPTRSQPETDWEDILQLILVHQLNPKDEEFRALILKHGGEEALEKILTFFP
jgi:hypothetical protein